MQRSVELRPISEFGGGFMKGFVEQNTHTIRFLGRCYNYLCCKTRNNREGDLQGNEESALILNAEQVKTCTWRSGVFLGEVSGAAISSTLLTAAFWVPGVLMWQLGSNEKIHENGISIIAASAVFSGLFFCCSMVGSCSSLCRNRG